jgi:hypothetical protein
MAYTPLSPSEHGHLFLTTGTFFHLKKQQVVPISVREAQRAGLDFPLSFIRGEKGLKLVAVLSLEPDDNVSIGPKGLWMGGYMPAVIRAWPFTMAIKDGTGHILIDPDSDWISRTKGEPLFDAGGNPAKVVNNRMELLKKRAPNPNIDGPVLDAVDHAGILVPWSKVSENLLTVDPQKLTTLDDREFVDLRQKNALAVIYAQLMSLPRVNRVKNLARRKEKMSERRPQDPGLIQDDDIISFD